ncbi:hypothetical protein MMC11_003661 [Xylographa trunciseda]|nr:hypothetical protein [Xylographa trunciseda]
MGVAFVVSIALMLLHATHLSRPAEQVKIIRITALIPAFALISFVNIYLGTSAVYLKPWMNVCEGLALASFYFLVCDFLSPDMNDRDAQFENLRLNPQGGIGAPGKGFAPARKIRNLVCQYIVVAIIVAVATDITEAIGVFCSNSNNAHFAHIWLTIIRAISAAVAIAAIIRFVNISHSRIPSQRIWAKLIAFKLIVGLDFIQTLAFSIAGAQFQPSSTLSYLDVVVAIPAILFCLEMAIISFVFHFVYSYRPYIFESLKGQKYSGGPLGIFAIGRAFNPLDMLYDITSEY